MKTSYKTTSISYWRYPNSGAVISLPAAITAPGPPVGRSCFNSGAQVTRMEARADLVLLAVANMDLSDCYQQSQRAHERFSGAQLTVLPFILT